MKKILILGIALCLLAAAGLAYAEEPAAEYNKGGFRIALPDGAWYEVPVSETATYYLADPSGSADQGMIMIQITPDETLVGVTLPDEALLSFYDQMKDGLAATAENGNVGTLDSKMNGTLARIFWYRGAMDNSGALFSVAAEVSFVGPNNVVILYGHPTKQPEEARDIVAAMGDSLQYGESGNSDTDSAGTGAGTASSDTAEIPTAENPYFFDPHSARERKLSTAMWMMDEKSRAYLTMYMMLNTADIKMPYPINVMASWIGSAEDIILIAIPSQDGASACIYMYNNEEQNACMFYRPWSDAELEEFKAACTDQVFQNSEDALVDCANELLSAAGVN